MYKESSLLIMRDNLHILEYIWFDLYAMFNICWIFGQIKTQENKRSHMSRVSQSRANRFSLGPLPRNTDVPIPGHFLLISANPYIKWMWVDWIRGMYINAYKVWYFFALS